MAVSFTQDFSSDDIEKFIKRKIAVVEDVIKDQLIDVAEQFVADARSVNTYTDRTRNLRGSIGYAVVKDGKEIFGNYDGVVEGQAVARRLVRSLRTQLPRGYNLIVVAGMEYAVFVEAKGYDVLTGSSLVADSNLSRQMKLLQDKLKRVK